MAQTLLQKSKLPKETLGKAAQNLAKIIQDKKDKAAKNGNTKKSK